MREKFEAQGEIAHLYKKFDFTNCPNHEVITDKELHKLREINWEICELMKYRGDNTMHSSFLLLGHSIERMIAARMDKTFN